MSVWYLSDPRVRRRLFFESEYRLSSCESAPGRVTNSSLLYPMAESSYQQIADICLTGNYTFITTIFLFIISSEVTVNREFYSLPSTSCQINYKSDDLFECLLYFFSHNSLYYTDKLLKICFYLYPWKTDLSVYKTSINFDYRLR